MTLSENIKVTISEAYETEHENHIYYLIDACFANQMRITLDCALGQVGSGFSTCNPTAWQPTGSGGSGFTLTTRSGLVNPLSISEPRLTL